MKAPYSVASSSFAKDAYLLDDVVAVRIGDGGQFYIYMLPLVQLSAVQPLTFSSKRIFRSFDEKELNGGSGSSSFDDSDDLDDNDLTQSFDFSDFLDLGFAPNHGKNEYSLFGVMKNFLVKIVYEIEQNEDTDVWEVNQNITRIGSGNFTGEYSRIEVTDDLVIASTADGENPGIYFYDHEWRLQTSFALSR